MDGDRPCAGIVFHDYKPECGTIQYSGAALDRRWLVGPALHLIFGHMFDRLGCQMVMTGNSEENAGLHSILRRLDHKCHRIERAWGPTTALMLWTLTREQWLANPIMQRSKKSFESEFSHV
jgi:RimJ/RimL family protein N-acetyltransferase